MSLDVATATALRRKPGACCLCRLAWQRGNCSQRGSRGWGEGTGCATPQEPGDAQRGCEGEGSEESEDEGEGAALGPLQGTQQGHSSGRQHLGPCRR